MSPTAHVFGYGSLATLGAPAELHEFERSWGVAMDNTRDLPGYKHYLLPSGERPALFVAFLDIAQRAGGVVNGVCTPVDERTLALLDLRERNYARVDVTPHVGAPPAARGRVWAYVGSTAGRERLHTGRARGTAVVERAYLELVRAAFAALGPEEAARAAPSLDPGDLPVRDLRRIDH